MQDLITHCLGFLINIWTCILLFRPHGDPQMMRFGAHLVLVLRYLLADQMKDTFKEKIMTVGDLIIHMWVYSVYRVRWLGIFWVQNILPRHLRSFLWLCVLWWSFRYSMFLFTTQHEELVGIYASQLARHRCVDLFVHMMELRLNSRCSVKGY